MGAARGLSQRAYAEHRRGLGLPGGTRTAVQKALRDGRIKTNRFGKIDPDQADEDWNRFTDPTARHERTRTITEAKVRLAEAEADLKELELAARRREMIPVAESRAIQFQFFRALRDACLALPAQIAPELGGLKTRARERKLMEALRRIFEQAAAATDEDLAE